MISITYLSKSSLPTSFCLSRLWTGRLWDLRWRRHLPPGHTSDKLQNLISFPFLRRQSSSCAPDQLLITARHPDATHSSKTQFTVHNSMTCFNLTEVAGLNFQVYALNRMSCCTQKPKLVNKSVSLTKSANIHLYTYMYTNTYIWTLYLYT